MAKAAIFDLDGTLLDSMADIGIACNEALAHHGYRTHAIEAYREFVGEGAVQLITRALAPLPWDEAVLETYKVLYPKHMYTHTQPYPGVVAALRDLAAQGLPLGVLSNKPHPATVTLVAHFFSDIPWRAVYGQRQEWPRKPDPTVALAMCGELATTPGDCAFVGDTLVDVATGGAAGMPTVGVRWGFRPAELEAADLIATFAHQLPRLIAAARCVGLQRNVTA